MKAFFSFVGFALMMFLAIAPDGAIAGYYKVTGHWPTLIGTLSFSIVVIVLIVAYDHYVAKPAEKRRKLREQIYPSENSEFRAWAEEWHKNNPSWPDT